MSVWMSAAGMDDQDGRELVSVWRRCTVALRSVHGGRKVEAKNL
jgi:hypothetical protein